MAVAPTFEEARRLAEWQPPLGVVSVYLRFEPGDRGGAWRTELRNGLAAVRDRGDRLEHDARAALRATAGRIAERFANHDRGLPRGEVGFVEVAPEPAGERWWATHLPPESTAAVSFADRPVVAPLLCLVEREALRGVALVSAERVRLLEWQPGRLEELRSLELSVFSRDWRELRAQRVPDPARSQAVSSSGREHFGDRLADNRSRFLGECQGLALALAEQRGWSELLAFGPPQHVDRFREHPRPEAPPVEAAGDADLISVPVGELEAPLEEAVERRAEDRDRQLAGLALEQGGGGARGSAGPQETLAALDEGRVERLVLDAGQVSRATALPAIDSESLVRRALESGAAISAVRGAAADLLAPVDGVAALLRY